MANVLILGKDLPESTDFIKSFELNAHKIFTPVKTGSVISMDNDNIITCNWNKASAISTKAMLIQAESRLENIDRIIIYFDACHFAETFQSDRVDEITAAMENMIYGYQYLVTELLTRFRQKAPACQIVFLLQTAPSKSSVSKNPGAVPCNLAVAAAQKAFEALAENAAYSFYDLNSVTPVIAYCDVSNALYRQERELGEWVLSFTETISQMKNRPTLKQCTSWVKAGSKSLGLSLFK